MLTEADKIFAAPQVVEVRQAFDEERALAEIRECIERVADGKSAQLEAGRILLEARKAMPDVSCAGRRGGHPAYSLAFLAFVEKAGIQKSTASKYMSHARNPNAFARHLAQRAGYRRATGGKSMMYRRKTLTEIRDALLESTREEVLAAINLELAGTFPNAEANT